MAKNSMTTLTITINAKQAENVLEGMKTKLKATSEELEKVREKLNDNKLWGEGDTYQGLKDLEKQLSKDEKSLKSAVNQAATAIKGVDEVLANISKASYNELTKTRTTLTNTLKTRKRETADELKAYEETAERLQKVRDEIARRDVDMKGSSVTQKAEAVLTTPSDYSTAEIKDAIKTMELLRNQTQVNTVEWHQFNNAIKNGEEFLQKWNDRLAMTAANKRQVNLPTISDQALAEQKKYWQEMVNGAEQGSAAIAKYKQFLSEVTAEEQRRVSSEAGKVMGNLQGSSVAEIQEAIKVTEKLRDAQARGSQEYEIYNEEIKRATEYLKSYTELEKQFEMEDKWQNLATLSANALSEQKKYWQEMVAGAGQGTTELAEYEAKLKGVVAEEQRRNQAQASKVMADPTAYSVREIEEAIKLTKELQAAQQPGSTAWKTYGEQIDNARALLDKYNNELKQTAMTDKLSTLATASTASLSEQKKYWQEMVNGAEQGSAALDYYKLNLASVTAEEQKRIQLSAQQTIADVKLGNWDKTIAESKEAVKQLQQYRDTLKDMGLKQVDSAIEKLNARIKGAQEGMLSMADALAKVDDLKNFDGTIEDLEKLKKRLEEIRKTEIAPGTEKSAEEYGKVHDAIKNVEKALNEAQSEAIDLDKILAKPKDASYKDLQRAAEVLKEKLEGLSESSDEFTRTSRNLREVNRQLERMNEVTREQENIFVKTAKKFLVYTSVSSLFYKAFEKGKEAFAKNTELTDAFADIQKTTGLASESVRELSRSIDSIDTRTAQAQLHELAAVAGQLGIKSQTDILGFVRASNMISVSLNELGGEGTSALMKIATLTGEASIGTEKALLSIGSAINELTANSAATAGPIVDLMNRMGGIAAQAGLTSAQLAGIGASANALGQSVEITGTAMNKFITTLMSNSDKIAYSLNMDAKALRNMLNEGRTMEAIVAVFERLNSMGGLGKIAGVMGDLESEGARMSQVLSALASNVEFLKSQIELSTDAYSQATSIQQEYNIKNENALAILQRIGNILHERIVNSSFTQGLTWVARTMLSLVQALTGGGLAAKSFAAAMAALTAAVIANKIAWVQHQNALGWPGWKGLLSNITRATASIVANIAALFTHQGALRAWRIVVESARKSWNSFTNFLKANWSTVLIAALAAVVGWIIKTITYVSELTRASARFHREVEEEKLAVDSLFASLKRTNTELNNRSRIISEINNKYSSYLGYMLSEHDSAEKLAAAHKLINAEIEKRMALNLQSTLQGAAANEYGEKFEEETTDISKVVKGEGLYSMSVWKGLVNAGEVNALISSAINEAVSAAVVPDESGRFNILGDINTDDILQSIKQQMQEKFGSEEIEKALDIKQGIGGTLFNAIKGNIKDLLEARVEYMENVLESEQMAGAEMARITKASVNASVENLQTIEDEFGKLEKVEVDNTWTEKQQVDHYAKMLDNAQDYVAAATKVLREIPESERSINNETLNERIAFYEKQAKTYAPLAKMDYWGKEQDVRDWKQFAEIIENLDTSSANALAAAFKKLNDESAKIPSEVEKFYEMFEGTGLQTKLKLDSPDDIAKTVHSWAELIRNKLKTKYGRNTELGFIFDSGSDKSAKQKAREQYKAALSALDAYYKEREALIREEGIKENKLQSTIDAQLESNQAAWKKDKVELIKMLVGDISEFDPFDNEGYMGVVTQNIFFGKNRDKGYLQQLATQLSKFGIVMEDGMRNTLSSALVELGKIAETEVERMKKILLQDDFTEQVAQQYMQSLDTLGLLFSLTGSEMSDGDAELGRIRLEAMREYAAQSYSLTAAELETKMKQNAAFSEWVIGREKESYEVLLNELRKFHDDQEEADRKAAERRKKIIENSAKGRALTQKNDQRISAEEEDVEMWNRFKGMDLVSDNTVDRAQIDVYQAKIAASQAWIEQIEAQMAAEKAQLAQEMTNVQTQISLMKMRGEDTSNLEAQFSAMQSNYISLTNQQDMMTLQHKQEIADAESEITNRRIAMQQRTVGEVQKYTDALTQFAYDAAYAEEDADATAEEARNNLIKSLLTSLKDWAQIKLTELTMNALFGQARVQQEAQETGSEMTLDALKAEGKVTTATVAATAEQTITKGLVGLAVGAAIGAALNALLGTALGKLNKKKAEVESIAGTSGKLATGMLTYAEGNYPVLGNDGNVYNAKYEGRGMKTGVYGGGAHFGIFSEKQPEAIIDGKTTKRLMLNYPEIWQSIVTLSRVGRIERGMRTFATGNINELNTGVGEQTDNAMQSVQWAQMQATLVALQQTQVMLIQRLNNPVPPNINMYGDGGMYKKMEKAQNFAKKRGYR